MTSQGAAVVDDLEIERAWKCVSGWLCGTWHRQAAVYVVVCVSEGRHRNWVESSFHYEQGEGAGGPRGRGGRKGGGVSNLLYCGKRP